MKFPFFLSVSFFYMKIMNQTQVLPVSFFINLFIHVCREMLRPSNHSQKMEEIKDGRGEIVSNYP